MSLCQALFKSDVFWRSNWLIKSDVRCLLLMKCYSTDSDRRFKKKIDQKFVESIRRQDEQRKAGREQFSYVNPTNDQRKIQERLVTKVFKFQIDLPTGDKRVPFGRRILNLFKSALELTFGGRRPDAFFFYRDQMNNADNLLIYVNESTNWSIVGWFFALLLPALAYRFVQLYRKEATLTLEEKELDFNLKVWQMVVWIGIYVLLCAAFLSNNARSVSTIYYNQQRKLFTLFAYPVPFFGRLTRTKLVSGVGQAKEFTAKYPILQILYPNTVLQNSKLNIYESGFIKPIYASLLYDRKKPAYL